MNNSPQNLSLFKNNNTDIAILQLNKKKKRGHQYTYGLDAVCDELSTNISKTVTPKTINECDTVLCSLCSTQDTISLACEINERPQSRLIVGGQGAYPFTAWRHLTHRIAFGRIEQNVDECILMNNSLKYCYDYDRDKDIEKKYIIRQARSLLKGESAVGCNGGCKFCQYSATRKSFGNRYKNSTRGHPIFEDMWKNLEIRTGQNTTALDGWSESTRKKIGKPISDSEIVEKLNMCMQELKGTMLLKVFQIVGYPWETKESVKEDIKNMNKILSRVKPYKNNSRVLMMFALTPFSPEPLTKMENEPANVNINWRHVLLNDETRKIYESQHLSAFILFQIPGPLSLYKRVAINRGINIDKLKLINKAKTIEDALLIDDNIYKANAGIKVSNMLKMEQRKKQTTL